MKQVISLLISFSFFLFIMMLVPAPVFAQTYYPKAADLGLFSAIVCEGSKQAVPIIGSCDELLDPCLADKKQTTQNVNRYFGPINCDQNNQTYNPGILGTQGVVVASLFNQQPSSREYIADLLDNIGIPTVSSAYAQGTGYTAMNPFLPIWKAFRNFAYSLYIIMFVVVGVMIMLRTKVNAQTVITIQAALPNLVITLLLITFSYAIVGFMIDLMYFLIYFVVYLVSSTGIISTPTQAIDRLLSYSAWSVIFEGRNSIISAVALAIGEVLSGLGTGALEVAGTLLSMASPMYLIVAVAFIIAMLKLMVALIKSYVMLIIQTVTAPVQILFNALPGSKSFSGWLKKTASYLIAFPVAASMFILAAVFVGDPTNSTLFGDIFGTGSANPFGINSSNEFYQNGNEGIWLPPFTLTGSVDFTQDDVMVIIGFFIFMMTPAAVKMAQDWLEVKESPYSAEAFANIGVGAKGGMLAPSWAWKTTQEEIAARRSAKHLSQAINRPGSPTEKAPPG